MVMVSKKLWRLSFIAVILLTGCQSGKHEDRSIAASEIISQVENIKDYFVTNIGITGFSGEVFCSYEPLNTEQGANSKIYLWALCQEYYLEQGALIPGSGISLPVSLRIQVKNDHYQVTDHLAPRDGTYYGPDVQAIFPPSTWSQILPKGKNEINQYSYRANKLEKVTKMQAKSYFGIGEP
jgi:hypothetical protein